MALILLTLIRNSMAGLNKINEIGEVQAQLDADEVQETLKEVTRAELDEHASNLDVADKDLFDAIRAAQTEVDAFLATSPDAQTLRDRLVPALSAATGVAGTPDEILANPEVIWLAGKLGIADELGMTGAPMVVQDAPEQYENAPAAETSELSPEREAELKGFIDRLVNQTREAFTAAGVTLPATIENTLNGFKEQLGNPQIAEAMALAEALEPNMEWLRANPDVLKRVMENSNFVSNLTGGNLAAVDSFLTGLESSLNGVTDEAEINRLIDEQLGTLPASPTATSEAVLNGPVEALISSVPDSMQTMFASEYEAWSAAMRVEGANRISFNDYIIQQAGGDQGKLNTINIKMQLASIIELLKPFLDAIKSMTGNGDDETEGDQTETPETVPTDPREMTSEQVAAAGGAEQAETNFQSERLTAVTNLLGAEGAPRIAEFSIEENGVLQFDEATARTFLEAEANRGFTAEQLTELITDVKARMPEAVATELLAQGRTLDQLRIIANLPNAAVESVSETGIKIKHHPVEITFEQLTDSAIVDPALEAYQKGLDDAQAEAIKEAEAIEAFESRNEFINKMAQKISTDAMASGWDGNDVVDNGGGGGTGFTIDDNGYVVVDIAQHTTYLGDWSADHVEFSIKNEFGDLAEIGYEGKSWEDVQSDLEAVLADQYLSELAGKTDWESSIRVNNE